MAGGGARFGARTRDAVLAPRPLPPRDPRGPRDARAAARRDRGAGRAIG